MAEQRSPESPEARRRGLGGRVHRRLGDLGLSDRAIEVIKRVAIGVWSDGFVHAGNLAYLSLLTLFPFFIFAAAIARLLGQTGDGLHALNAFLRTVPPNVADVLQQPVADVLAARTGALLWFGAAVGLWTAGSFVETVRLILQQAYGVESRRPFWENRLGSIGLIIASVILVMLAFSFQVVLTGIEQFITRVLPVADSTAQAVSLTRIAPGLALFGALYMLFYTLTPGRYRNSDCPKWPGAAFTAGWWLATTALLPVVLGLLGSYDLTYGSLAGVMITLLFFFVVGLGVVVGAELNAALAEEPDSGLEGPNEAENKEEQAS
ncbi:YihY/virulence factor BrkB family protein [Stakelama saccharophila]|uniref:YihY/virulence factor BrkB family protein n=1 Tax=Stakelama saccharophila TaxID=3075605 RepID=A0ABZ0B8Y9_9SPHN|nr:YihY/virulence factor BrkB family protein [Stakelama sp. W311]WNO53887.1 YihY/virulence factor BrkB family protein [Stakelama sp. W311]